MARWWPWPTVSAAAASRAAVHFLVAFAVLIETTGSGASVAAPVFPQTASAALRFLNEPVDAGT